MSVPKPLPFEYGEQPFEGPEEGYLFDDRPGELASILSPNSEPASVEAITATQNPLTPEPNDIELPIFESSDLGNARTFKHLWEGKFLVVAETRNWHPWNGNRWAEDPTGAAMRAAKQTADLLLQHASAINTYDRDEAKQKANEKRRDKRVTWCLRSQDVSRLQAMLNAASTEAEIIREIGLFDTDPYLLSVANGTLDLRTGTLRPSDPADLITLGSKVVYDPAADCPTWRRFLGEVFQDDADLIEYVQRAIGYSLTGETREHKFFPMYGPQGRNGKSTIVGRMHNLLGKGLAESASFATFLRRKVDGEQPHYDLAALHRARFVSAAEPQDGAQLDAAIVKNLTGDDLITCRFMYGGFFNYMPRFKIWLNTNHLPRVSAGDEAIWARVAVIPFNVSFLGREDRTLPTRLDSELPGILNWALEGCLAWRKHGLGTCKAVEIATDRWRADVDIVGAFLDEHYERTDDGKVEADVLRANYEDFCKQHGEKPLVPSEFGKELKRHGLVKTTYKPYAYRGLRRRDQPQGPV